MAVIEGEKIKVSVVVAVYNSSAYLHQNLDSICSQSLENIEIILVDDGSTDGSDRILEEYAAKDSRIRVLYQRESSDGAALARNMGVEAACGEYVSVLDADDFFEMDMLEKAYIRAKETEAELVIFDGDLYDEKIDAVRETGMILRREFLPEGKDTFTPRENADRLFFMTIGSAWNVLFSKELIDREALKFNSFHHADDLGFVYLGFAAAKKIAIMPERLIHYRCNNPNSQAGTLYKWPEAAGGAFAVLKTELERRDLFAAYQVTFTEMALHYFELYLEQMPDYNSFENLYLSWKEKYLHELALTELPDERLRQKRIIQIRQKLVDHSPGEYIFERMKCGELFTEDAGWRNRILPEDRVIIYAAGKMGRRIFSEALGKQEFIIAGWADKQYGKLGYPIISPEEAVSCKHDHMLVAVESKDVYEKITEELKKAGEAEDKLIWAGDTE